MSIDTLITNLNKVIDKVCYKLNQHKSILEHHRKNDKKIFDEMESRIVEKLEKQIELLHQAREILLKVKE